MNPVEETANPVRWYADAPVNTAVPELDADVPVLDDAGARKLNMRALWILVASIVVMLVLMLWVGRSFGRGAPAKPVNDAAGTLVESPALPGSETPQATDATHGGGSGGAGTGNAADSTSEGLPPLPPEPVQLAHGPAADMEAAPPSTAQAMDVPSTSEYRAPSAPPRASLVQRRIWNGDQPGAEGQSAQPVSVRASESTQADARVASAGKVRRLRHPSSVLVRGSSLRCVLSTRIVSDLDGMAECVLVEPVFAFDGQRLLMQKGTRLMGRYGSGSGVGDRLAVTWDRALTPEGLDVDLGGMGSDTLGGAGHPGKGSSHWGERIASALLISLLSDAFKYAGAKHGPVETAVYSGGTIVTEPYNSNTAKTAQDLANQALAQGTSRPRTIILKQGTLLNVLVTEDIDFHEVLEGGDRQ